MVVINITFSCSGSAYSFFLSDQMEKQPLLMSPPRVLHGPTGWADRGIRGIAGCDATPAHPGTREAFLVHKVS